LSTFHVLLGVAAVVVALGVLFFLAGWGDYLRKRP
jgi:nitrogen fixation-related uncharacterized protein